MFLGLKCYSLYYILRTISSLWYSWALERHIGAGSLLENVMHARHPDQYPDQVCCVCEIQDEDSAHIWQCSANSNVHNEIWEEGIARIDGWGQTATSKYNKKAKEKHQQAILNGKSKSQVPKKA